MIIDTLIFESLNDVMLFTEEVQNAEYRRWLLFMCCRSYRNRALATPLRSRSRRTKNTMIAINSGGIGGISTAASL